MDIEITRDGDAFLDRARPFLEARIERNVLATVAQISAEQGGFPGEEAPYYALGVDPLTKRVVAAAVRTPPRHIIAAGWEEPDEAGELLRAWLVHDPNLTGVSAEPGTARALVAAWIAHTGGGSELDFSEALHDLTAVVMPAPAPPGELRVVRPQERDLLAAWLRAFRIETNIGDPSGTEAEADRALIGGRFYVWDDGVPTSLVAHSVRVAGVSRIGPVYTPPEHRGRGYASVAVATLSQQLLDEGAERCMLFTDLANPTSNKIYAAVGYRRFGAWEEHAFLARRGV